MVAGRKDHALWIKQRESTVSNHRFRKQKNNYFIITNQYRFHTLETKIPDLVLLINSIPVVIGEAKTPVPPSVSWLDRAHEIRDVYENAVPQLFDPNIFSFASEGKKLY